MCWLLTNPQATIIGRRFGRHKWHNSPKSIEGTIGGTLTSFITLVGLVYIYYGVLAVGIYEVRILVVAICLIPSPYHYLSLVLLCL